MIVDDYSYMLNTPIHTRTFGSANLPHRLHYRCVTILVVQTRHPNFDIDMPGYRMRITWNFFRSLRLIQHCHLEICWDSTLLKKRLSDWNHKSMGAFQWKSFTSIFLVSPIAGQQKTPLRSKKNIAPGDPVHASYSNQNLVTVLDHEQL